MSNRTVTVGGRTVAIEPFSARKINRALRLLRAIANSVPDLLDRRAEFRRAYEASNYVELPRSEALRRYGAPLPLLTPEGDPVRDEQGALVTVPAPIAEMGEEAWAAQGQVHKVPRSPEWGEELFALFPMVLDQAEEAVMHLLALVTLSNDDVKRWSRDGSLNDQDHPGDGPPPEKWGRLRQASEDLLDDAMGDELMELAVVAGEVVDDQLLSKARRLMDEGRLGNVLRLFGMDPSSLNPNRNGTTPAESSEDGQPTSPTPGPTPVSSSDSPAEASASDPPTSSTTSPTTSSTS